MKKQTTFLLATLCGLLALVSGGAAAFVVYKAPEARAASLFANALLESRAAEYKSVFEQRSLVRETEEGRAELARLTGKDALAIVETLEKVGRDAGIPLEIDQAQAPSALGKNKLRSVGFVVRGQGSFSGVMRAFALMEHIAIPSRVDEVSFETPPETTSSGARRWTFTARVTVYTAADLAL
jgi:hypothetical protein